MTDKRFRYNSTSQIITDDMTGYTYYGNKQVCDLLNKESDKRDLMVEKYVDTQLELNKINTNYEICREKMKAYFKVLEKYHIHNPEKLDACLREGRVW